MRYVFTEEQFAVLLAAAKVRGLYLFPLDCGSGDASLVGALAELCRLGALVESGGGVVPSDFFAEIIGAMAGAAWVLKLIFSDGSFPQQLIYPAGQGKIVVLEREARISGNVIKLQRTGTEEYILDLKYNEMLPGDQIAGSGDNGELEEMALESLSTDYGPGDVLLRAQWINTENEEPEREIIVFSSDIFRWVHTRRGDEDSYHLYSSDKLAGLLAGLLEEG